METFAITMAFLLTYLMGFFSCLAGLAFVIRRAEQSVLAAKKTINVRDLYPNRDN